MLPPRLDRCGGGGVDWDHVQRKGCIVDDDVIEKYKSRLEDKAKEIEISKAQVEIQKNALRNKEKDYEEEVVRQQKFQELLDERAKINENLSKHESGTADWYSHYNDLVSVEKKLNKAVRGWKNFW